MSEVALELRQISKTFGRVRANDSISFAVKKGTIHGLAGENGAGKSTLMKIVFGLYEPDPGSAECGVYLNGRKSKIRNPQDAMNLGIGMVQQHFALVENLTALDNIILGQEPMKRFNVIDRAFAKNKLQGLVSESLKVPLEANVEDLQVGVHQRVELLKLLYRDSEILILDEPTAVLTPQEIDDLFSFLRDLRKEGKTVLIITHKLDELLALCDDVTVLRQGSVKAQLSRDQLTKEALVKAMTGRSIEKFIKPTFQPGAEALVIQNLTTSAGTEERLKEVCLSVRQGETVGIAGVEGNGQSTLVECLLGLTSYIGHIQFNGQPYPHKTKEIREVLNVGYVSEDRQTQSLWLSGTLEENCAIGFGNRLARYGVLSKSTLHHHAEEMLKGFDVKYDHLEQKISELSGGNQQKLVVARELKGRDPRFLLCCHPTRGVDVGAIELIHQRLVEFQKNQGAVLLISSELEELLSLSDRLLVMYQGRIVLEQTRENFDLKSIGSAMLGGQP
ncbi:MAG: ABC transporter ATP-binding protein [Oligoflexia bacterium]|nr:ABC transporter ATP-binding protein [Oligoflexia bacterium]